MRSSGATCSGTPTSWAYDVGLMLYGALFMMAGAYTLSAQRPCARRLHLPQMGSRRRRPRSDLVLYFLFYFPGHPGADLFRLETTSSSPICSTSTHPSARTGPVIWPFKALIPITGVMMLLQGVVEVVRCVICIRTGDWPHSPARRRRDGEGHSRRSRHQAQSRKGREATTRGVPVMFLSDPALGILMLVLFLVFPDARLPDRRHADGARRRLRLLHARRQHLPAYSSSAPIR